MNVNMDLYIANGDNLDEKISVVEFIKTLKKVDSDEMMTAKFNRNSCSSSNSSTEKVCSSKGNDEEKDKLKKVVEKRTSATDVLSKMRSRFQHRATEPIFHNLAPAETSTIGPNESGCEGGRGGGSDGSLNGPIVSLKDRLKDAFRGDSEPAIFRSSSQKYLDKTSS